MARLSNNYPLMSWSWGDIQRAYIVYGAQLEDYSGIGKRFNVPAMGEEDTAMQIYMENPDSELVIKREDFIARFYYDIGKINLWIKTLDTEIARRNKLVGVM